MRCHYGLSYIRPVEFLSLSEVQEMTVKASPDGKDVLARLSTGFGESLIHQLALLEVALSYC